MANLNKHVNFIQVINNQLLKFRLLKGSRFFYEYLYVFKYSYWFQVVCLLQICFESKPNLSVRQSSEIFYICVLFTFIYHIWLYLTILNCSGDTEKILDQSLTQSPTIYENNLLFTNFMLCLYQRIISIQPFYMAIIFSLFYMAIIFSPFYMAIIFLQVLCKKFHPINIKPGGFCVYYKIYFPMKIKNIYFLQECISLKQKSKAKKKKLVCGNRPGQIFFITHLPAQSNVYQNIHF